VHGFHGGQAVILLLCHQRLGDLRHGHHRRVVGCHDTVDEVILALRPARVYPRSGSSARAGRSARRTC
jgi:hypothetical protein